MVLGGRRLRDRPAFLIGGLDLSQRHISFLEAEQQLIGIELLGTAAELVPLQGFDDRPQTIDLGVHVRQLVSLFEHDGAQAINVILEVRVPEHGSTGSARQSPVYRQFARLLDAAHHACVASPDPRSRWPVGLPSGA